MVTGALSVEWFQRFRKEIAMPLKVTVDKRTEWCDVCEVRNGADESEPRSFIVLCQKSKGEDRQFVFVHVDCLERKIARAKKQAEKQSVTA